MDFNYSLFKESRNFLMSITGGLLNNKKFKLFYIPQDEIKFTLIRRIIKNDFNIIDKLVQSNPKMLIN